jgi:thioesterase domain-containing protein
MAHACIKALMSRLKGTLPSSPLIIGGVGHGAIVAHEAALQLQAVGITPRALALFEGRFVAANTSADLGWLPRHSREALAQIATSLYSPLKKAGGKVPLDAIAARLASLPTYEMQISYLRSLCNPGFMPRAEWEQEVELHLLQLAFFRNLASQYDPIDIFSGQTLLFTHLEDPRDARTALQGPAGVWNPIARVLQPVSLHLLPTHGSAAGGQIIQDILIHTTTHKSECTEISVVMATMGGGNYNNNNNNNNNKPLIISPTSGGGASKESPTGVTNEDTVQNLKKHAKSLIIPLNRLCPELKSVPGVSMYDEINMSNIVNQKPPKSRIPLFFIHGERGDMSLAQRELAASLPFPVYGVVLGSGASTCRSLNSLARHHAKTIQAVSVSGPHLILGQSVGGVTLAHLVACRLQEGGSHVALLTIDGSVGPISQVPLHNPSMYALYSFLREVVGLNGTIGEFVDSIQGCGGPGEQYQFLSSLKPTVDNGVDVDKEWECAIYALLDRAHLLERLILNHHRGRHRKGAVKIMEENDGTGTGTGTTVDGTAADTIMTSTNSKGDMDWFNGPTVMLLPQGEFGELFVDGSKAWVGEAGLVKINVKARHTELLLGKGNFENVVNILSESVEGLLRAKRV